MDPGDDQIELLEVLVEGLEDAQLARSAAFPPIGMGVKVLHIHYDYSEALSLKRW